MKFGNKKLLAVAALAIGGYFVWQAMGKPGIFRASSYPIGIVNSVAPSNATAQSRLQAGLF